jgi:glutathione S-transferase
MHAYALTALVTLLAIALYFAMGIGVGAARAKYKVAAPATTGDLNFERIFRVQMNTLEWMPIFLPSLWMFAILWDDRIAAAIGGVWLLGRLMYMLGYASDAQSRGLGFAVQGLAALALWLGATAGVVMALVATHAG